MVQSFGGSWTETKLQSLEEYLDAYTTALKEQPSKENPFNLIYVDAFAGEGAWQPKSSYAEDYGDYQQMVEGSARIALKIKDKQFDRLIFIEKNAKRVEALWKLKNEHRDRDIVVLNDDANNAVPTICDSLAWNDRLVVFLDPFATSVEWKTVEKLAHTEKVDCWILFPLSAVARILPTDEMPPPQWAERLDVVFGGREHWESFYEDSAQLPLFGERGTERTVGSDAIAARYKERLTSVFAQVAPTSRTLKNSKNSPLFELFFAASNRRGAPIAVRIANYILTKW